MAHQYANGLADGFLLSPRALRGRKRSRKIRGRPIAAPAPAAPEIVYVKDIAAEFSLKSPHRRVLTDAGFDIDIDKPMAIPAAQAAALRLELSHRVRRSDEYIESYLIGILHNRVQFRMNEYDQGSGPLVSTAEIISCVPPGALRRAISLGKEHRFIHKSALEDTVVALQELVAAKLKAEAVADTAVARQDNARFMLEADAATVVVVEEGPLTSEQAVVPEPAPVRWTRNFKHNGSSVNVSGTREWFDRLARFVEVDLCVKNGGTPVQLSKVIHDALDAMMNGDGQVATPAPAPTAPVSSDRMAILKVLGEIVEETIDRKVGADLAEIKGNLASLTKILDDGIERKVWPEMVSLNRSMESIIGMVIRALHRPRLESVPVFPTVEVKQPSAWIKIKERFSLRS